MKLKEIVKQAMLLLNIPPDPNDFAENAPEPTDATLISLISCANSAISDAASNYARVYKTETLSTDSSPLSEKTSSSLCRSFLRREEKASEFFPTA